MTDTIILEMDDLRAVAAYAAECAMEALGIFEQANPGDMRLRDAIDAARAFASGGKRVEALRDVSWAALRAAQDADNPVVSQAARAAMAASAAYLHPLAKATQVKHILGAAAHAAGALELAAGDATDVGDWHIARAAGEASPRVLDILRRCPPRQRVVGEWVTSFGRSIPCCAARLPSVAV